MSEAPAGLLSVLIIDDSENDARLLERYLGRAGYRVDSKRVDEPVALRAALEHRAWDVALCDYAMPGFGAVQALEIVRGSGIDLPVIVISGTVGEEVAVQTMKAGAHDYLLKQNLVRLVPAIERERREARSRVERRRAEAELQQYREHLEQLVAERTTQVKEQALIIDQIRDPVVSIGSQGAVLSWNKGAEGLFGYTAEEAKGQYIGFVLATRDGSAAEQAILDPLQDNDELELDLAGKCKSGATFPARVSLSVLGGDKEGGRTVVAYILDMTEMKRQERMLEQSKAVAEEANRAKSEFLSRMSHELRTPLNAILGFAQLLEDDEQPPLSVQQRDNVVEILRGGRHLLDLINDILDLARIEAGKVEMQLAAVPVDQLVQESCAMIEPLAAARGVKLKVDVPPASEPYVRADSVRLKQVLLNLLSNGVKYNHERGSVAVSWLNRGDSLRIQIIDTGPGISARDQDRLFEPFERLSQQDDTEGTGLGLAVSRRLVEAMGGQIGASSAEGHGACFWVELPRADAQHPIGRGAQRAGVEDVESHITSMEPRTVLYVEDNLPNRRLIAQAFAANPAVTVICAEDGATGLAIAASRKPDLVLLDVGLPDIDGYEVLARLRRDQASARTPVIALTASAQSGERQRAKAAGFDEYMTKPVDLAELRRVVDGFLFPAEPTRH